MANENLIQEAEAAVKAFIQNVETTLIQDAEAAGAWLLAELKALAPEVLSDLKAAVAAAAQEAISGAGAGNTVADTLTILARDGADILAQVKSEVVSAVVGLTTVKPTA